MSHYLQNRLREIASGHPSEAQKYFQALASDSQVWWCQLLTKDGYQPVRFNITMTRPCSEPIDIHPLPEGIEVRPAKPTHYRQIWEAHHEAFQDSWGYPPPTEENYKSWLEYPYFQPHLWKVAWDGDQVIGRVGNHIAEDENQE